jgi:signal transduction histidine kinase/CheY-like chemotaxis protein
VTFLSWSNYVAIVPFAVEIIIIHIAIKKNKNPFISGIVYWLTVGWFIAAIQLTIFTNYVEISKIAITFKYLLNGIINVMLGYLIAFVLSKYTTTQWQEKFKIHLFISLTVSFILTVAIFTHSFFWLKNIQEDKLEKLSTSLLLEARMTAKELKSYINNHVTMMTLAAKLSHNENDAISWQNSIANIKSTYPSILTMLVTQKSGNLIATAPKDLINKIKKPGNDFVNVNTRPYFLQSKKTMKPFVSDVFQGKGFGNDPIIAISVPLSDNKGFVGILEASLDLKTMKNLDIKSLSDDQSLLIFDGNHKVIYSSENLPYSFLQSLGNLPVSKYITSPETYFYKDSSGEYRIGMSEVITGLNWTIFISVPMELYEAQIVKNVFFSTKLFFIFLIISIIITYKFAKLLSRPIEELNENLLSVNKTGDFDKLQLNLKPSMFIELNSMSSIIQDFSKRLNKTLSSLHDARKNSEELNSELAQVNKNLEAIIEEKTQDLQAALITATNANKAKSEFLATMSHEIRTPLNGVLGMLELLSTSDISLEHLEKINIAQTSAKVLLSLLNDILDFSKIEAGKLEIEYVEFSLLELLSDVVISHALSAENKGLQLLLDTEKVVHSDINCDPTRLKQILTNLIGNSIKFTQSGQITVRCKTLILDKNIQLEISVKDTGIGIKESKLQTLFTPFVQADSSTTRKFGGSGLGLTISKQLCKLMSGDISATSEIGKKTTFIATILAEPARTISHMPSFSSDFDEAIIISSSSHYSSPIVEDLLRRFGIKCRVIKFNDQNQISSIIDKEIIGAEIPSDKPKIIIIDESCYCDHLHKKTAKLKSKKHHVLWLTALSTTLENTLKENAFTVCRKPITPVSLSNTLKTLSYDSKDKANISEVIDITDNLFGLIVEDNRINQKVAANMLSALNIPSDIANNGIEALKTLSDAPSKYNFVLMDCQMPEMDGFEATEKIRAGAAGESVQNIHIIALTANAIKGDKEKCVASGMNDYLLKPLALNKLKTALKGL